MAESPRQEAKSPPPEKKADRDDPEKGKSKEDKPENKAGKPDDEKKDESDDDKKDESDGDKKDQPKEKSESHRPSKKVIVIGAIVVAALLVFGVIYWLRSRGRESTDDAYVTGHLHQISARVAGTVNTVLVDDNEHVENGQPLVKLDPRDYEVALQKARAGLTQAQASVGAAQAALAQATANALAVDANVFGAEAQGNQASAQFEKNSLDFNRSKELFDKKVIAKAEFDAAKAGYETARAAFEAAKAGLATARDQAKAAHASEESARAQVTVAEANVSAAEATLRDAELQLSYTQIPAPVAGRVSRKTVEAGQRLQPGQALMAVVEDNIWVLANMKETQLDLLEVGQRVEIRVDALKRQKFTGKVDSIQAGSGATFALLPPDNATGNFTKIVQRVPVKIVFDEDSIRDFRDKVVPGLSVVPTVDLKSGPSGDLRQQRRQQARAQR